MNLSLLHRRWRRRFGLVLGRLLDDRSPVAEQLRRRRLLVGITVCAAVSAVSFLLAFIARFELSPQEALRGGSWAHWYLRSVGLVVAVRVTLFLGLGLYRTTWRYAGARDMLPVTVGTLVGSAVIGPLLLWFWGGFYPRSVLAMEGVFFLVLLVAVRFSYRMARELLAGGPAPGRTPVIVLGAGAAGNLVVRAMHGGAAGGLHPVALLDDNPLKQGTSLHGVPVLGAISDVGDVIRRTGARALVMALPTATASEIYRVVQICRPSGLPLKTTPDLARILAGGTRGGLTTPITDFRLEDLLHRRPIRPVTRRIGAFLANRTVLVTGAAGSIGSELCRQIVEQGAGLLVCLDKDENRLFHLEQALAPLDGATETVSVLGDVRDPVGLEEIFTRWRPDIVFHAAAYKHVPLLQYHPSEAVLNNVAGTRLLATLADRHEVEDFVLISTDKAVNPTSVMGATKRIAERVVRTIGQRSATRFSVLRFGNVLGSNGSVVELFLKQIRAGGPVTVTHPDIERYFMTIPESVQLVLFAAAMKEFGGTFILEMGKPVRIADLAAQMIRLSGLTPGLDVAIEFTDLRPGEKLTEELWTSDEQPQPTSHPGILRAPGQEGLDVRELRDLDLLVAAATDRDTAACWRGLLRLVPSFQALPEDAAAGSARALPGRVVPFPERQAATPPAPASRRRGEDAPEPPDLDSSLARD